MVDTAVIVHTTSMNYALPCLIISLEYYVHGEESDHEYEHFIKV